MKELSLEQLEVLTKIDPGFPEWKGDILKHFSTAELNLARIDLESGRIQRPEFLVRIRKAMSLVQVPLDSILSITQVLQIEACFPQLDHPALCSIYLLKKLTLVLSPIYKQRYLFSHA
jgi:hypothetical protein